jgi:putative transposase
MSKKTEVEDTRASLAAEDHFYYGDEVNLSLFPTLRKMWMSRGEQVQILTHGQDERAYGIGAVNYHTGETVMITREHKCKVDVAVFLRALLARHETGTIYLTWDNCYTHFGGEIDAILKEAHGRLVLLYLPTYSPWLNPIEMLWRSMRYNVTHCELFVTIGDLEVTFLDYFATTPKETILSVIGSKAA